MGTTDNLLSKDAIIDFLHPDLESKELHSVEEELLKDYDPAEIFRAHKDDLSELQRCMKLLEMMKAAYDPDKHDRVYAERLYILVMDILYHMARRFHPLSDHGQEILGKAIEYRKEFEKKHGALVSAITKKNAELFGEVLSEDIVDEIIRGRCRGIGALRGEKEGIYAAGALCYYIDSDPLDNEPVLRVKWLYVDEEYRGTGVASALIGEMVYQMAQLGNISAMTLDFPAELPEAELLGDLLQEWHFSFMTGLTPECICSSTDINKEDLKKYSGKTKSMEGVKDKDIKIKGYPEGTFEKELSFYTGDIKKPDSVLLGHFYPSKTVRVEYLHCKQGSEKDLLFLLADFLLKVTGVFHKDTEIIIPVEAEEVGEVLDKLIPVQNTDLLVEGVLMRPSEDENLTSQDLKELISSLE